jgi:CDP-diacylglycerol--serine O-phosphatidyltransferase
MTHADPQTKIRSLPKRRKIGPPLRKGVYLLPNLFTTGGLFCGFYAIIATLGEEYVFAAIAVLVAMVFDGLDGRIARLTKTSSKFGVEYDSLADLVAFGVAPGVLAYCWALEPWQAWGWLAAALYVTCGALRLARFNVRSESADTTHFVGLPIPAASAVVATTVLMDNFLGGEGGTTKQIPLLLLIYTLAGLMVSNIRYYSFKELKLRGRQPFWLLLLSIFAIQVTIAQPHIMLFGVSWCYALSGPVRLAVRLGRLGVAKLKKTPPDPPLQNVRPLPTLDTDKEGPL